jgi:Tfp pilus assembly protein PilX
MLLVLTSLALAVLLISALDPQISRNHTDLLRARYLAEAGVEYAFDRLAAAGGSWDAYLAGATCTSGQALPALSDIVPALPATIDVRLRNDCGPDDHRLTGVAPEPADAGERDANARVVVMSTAVVNGTGQSIAAAIGHSDPSAGPGQTVARELVTTYSWSDQ